MGDRPRQVEERAREALVPILEKEMDVAPRCERLADFALRPLAGRDGGPDLWVSAQLKSNGAESRRK